MVGAYDWDGGVLKETSEGRLMPPREAFEKEFPLELKNHAAYLGNNTKYSFKVLPDCTIWSFLMMVCDNSYCVCTSVAGYTVSSVVVGDWRRLYVAGAPRFKHKGKVILFDLTPNGDVIITQALNGEQVENSLKNAHTPVWLCVWYGTYEISIKPCVKSY